MVYRKIIVKPETTILASYNPRRVSLTIINMGNYTVYISEDPQKITEEGFPLLPGTYITLAREDGDASEKAYYSICPEGEVELRIEEGII
jgi:hypothetical protein